MEKEKFTRYEIARIIGARALQIAMDAPFLYKFTNDELKAMNFDPIKIAEKELEKGVLPISIMRPMPQKRKQKLVVKEEKISDEDIVAKEQEVEKELVESANELGLVEGDEIEDYQDEPVSTAGSASEEQ